MTELLSQMISSLKGGALSFYQEFGVPPQTAGELLGVLQRRYGHYSVQEQRGKEARIRQTGEHLQPEDSWQISDGVEKFVKWLALKRKLATKCPNIYHPNQRDHTLISIVNSLLPSDFSNVVESIEGSTTEVTWNDAKSRWLARLNVILNTSVNKRSLSGHAFLGKAGSASSSAGPAGQTDGQGLLGSEMKKLKQELKQSMRAMLSNMIPGGPQDHTTSQLPLHQGPRLPPPPPAYDPHSAYYSAHAPGPYSRTPKASGGVVCHCCGGVGHYARDCPSNPKAGSSSSSNRGGGKPVKPKGKGKGKDGKGKGKGAGQKGGSEKGYGGNRW